MWGIPWVHRWMFSTSEGYHDTVGEQLDKILSISIENSDVLNIPWCTHDIPPMYSWYPPMYSWYPPDVLMVSPTCIMISPYVLNIPWCTHESPRCTHGIPPMYWTSPDVLMVSLQCTEHPSMYLMNPPDVLNTPRCTEHPLMYWTDIIQGGNEKPYKQSGPSTRKCMDGPHCTILPIRLQDFAYKHLVRQ